MQNKIIPGVRRGDGWGCRNWRDKQGKRLFPVGSKKAQIRSAAHKTTALISKNLPDQKKLKLFHANDVQKSSAEQEEK